MALSTADIVSSITVDGESTNHVELDWGDSVRLNISVPTDPAYANIVPHLVTPGANQWNSMYVSEIGVDSTGDFQIDQLLAVETGGNSVYLTGVSSSSVNNAGNEVFAYSGVTDADGSWTDMSDQSAFLYIFENVEGNVEFQKVDLSDLPFQVASSFYRYNNTVVNLLDESGYAVINQVDNNKLFVTNVVETDSGSYEVADRYMLHDSIQSYQIIAADQTGVYHRGDWQNRDLFYSDDSQAVTIFEPVDPADYGTYVSNGQNYNYSISDSDSGAGLDLTVSISNWDTSSESVIHNFELNSVNGLENASTPIIEVSAFGESAGQSFTDLQFGGRYTFEYQLGKGENAQEIVPVSSFYVAENAVNPTNPETAGYRLHGEYYLVNSYDKFIYLRGIDQQIFQNVLKIHAYVLEHQ